MDENSKIEEWLDLVDEADNIVGEVRRSEIYEKNLVSQVRAVWLFIRNSEGKLWIPRRHGDKKILPLALDGSAVGCVSRGESYEQALHREVLEELNINLEEHNYQLLGHLLPVQHGTWCMVKVFELLCDDVPAYEPLEFSEHFWLTPQEVIDKILQGDKAKSDLPIILNRLYCDK